MSKGKLFVISAPSGAGKSTLVDMVCERLKGVVRSISCTTRSPRGEERDGIDYHFLSKEEFDKREKQGEFLETATLYDNRYGTLKKTVEEEREKGNHVLLVIDTQGAKSVSSKTDATLIFIMPPSIEELEERLRGRKTESEAQTQKRLGIAKQEIERAKEYDCVILNQDLETAFAHLQKILGER